MAETIDMTGKTFGRLKVLKRVENTKDGRARWLCECSCSEHKQVIVQGKYLRNGNTQSCGWLRKERAVEALRKVCKKSFNKYEEIEYEGERCAKIFDDNGNYCIINIEDISLVNFTYWYKDNQGYFRSETTEQNKTSVTMMHRVILGLAQDDKRKGDHKNRKRFDNTRKNLRVCTQAENVRNKSLYKNNHSGFPGIGWIERLHKYQVNIRINDKQIYIGIYANMDDAIKARLKAEAEYFGEFAPHKDLFKQYGIYIKQTELGDF